MSINIQLARGQNAFTNMDYISGKVLLYLTREEAFNSIYVKLEGESRTRLAHPIRQDNRNTTTELEVHKTVFPTNPVLGAKQYTLAAGQYEFPFSFRIPFNNSCNENNIKRVKMGALAFDVQDVNRHTKAPLPPTVGGFPGEAEIKYFVKVTGERAAFYKENFRSQVGFKFLPIEKPRPAINSRETYGRRKHQFSPYAGTLPSKSSTSTMFRRNSSSTATDTMLPPQITVDARLPDPAILTCGKPLPLRVLVTKLNDSPAAIYLRTFHVTLWGHTRIRAHELERIETSSWILSSVANMSRELRPETVDGASPSTPTPTPSGPSNTGSSSNTNNPFLNSLQQPSSSDPKSSTTSDLYPMIIPPEFWQNSPLPPSVAPSFETCNLARWYELEISVGLSWGSPGGRDIRPELTVQPIRLKVDVYSGIAPSPALITRFLSQRHGGASSGTPAQPPRPLGPGHPGPMGAGPGFGPGPAAAPGASTAAAAATAAADGSVDPGAAGPSSAQAHTDAAPAYDDAPPSYEDAMADDLAPVDGYRGNYHVPDSAPVGDRKRRDS